MRMRHDTSDDNLLTRLSGCLRAQCRNLEKAMVINNDFELVYLVIAFAFLGVILFGSLLVTLHLDRWHPKLIGALIGALLGVVLIEAVPMFT